MVSRRLEQCRAAARVTGAPVERGRRCSKAGALERVRSAERVSGLSDEQLLRSLDEVGSSRAQGEEEGSLVLACVERGSCGLSEVTCLLEEAARLRV
jgi:hypothetical protein